MEKVLGLLEGTFGAGTAPDVQEIIAAELGSLHASVVDYDEVSVNPTRINTFSYAHKCLHTYIYIYIFIYIYIYINIYTYIKNV